MKPLLSPLLALALLLGAGNVTAQQGEPSGALEFGLHGGPFLPARISRVTETMMGWGARLSQSTRYGTFELDNTNFHTKGVSYNTTSVDFRLSSLNDHIPLHVLLGAHGDFFKGRRREKYRFVTGWHYGGGVMTELIAPVWLRLDFTYRFSPGEALYVGVGLVYRFSSSEGPAN